MRQVFEIGASSHPLVPSLLRRGSPERGVVGRGLAGLRSSDFASTFQGRPSWSPRAGTRPGHKTCPGVSICTVLKGLVRTVRWPELSSKTPFGVEKRCHADEECPVEACNRTSTPCNTTALAVGSTLRPRNAVKAAQRDFEAARSDARRDLAELLSRSVVRCSSRTGLACNMVVPVMDSRVRRHLGLGRGSKRAAARPPLGTGLEARPAWHGHLGHAANV